MRALFRQTVVLAASHTSRSGCGFLEIRPRWPKTVSMEVTRKGREGRCRATARRDCGMVMITDACMFHYRFPGSELRQGRWANECAKRSQLGFTPSHSRCHNEHTESPCTVRETAFQWSMKMVRPFVITVIGEARREPICSGLQGGCWRPPAASLGGSMQQ